MTLTAPADLAAATPSRNDRRNDTAATCPACGQPFTPSGRRRWCSDACRQAAWRRRHPAPGPAAAGLPAPRRPARDATIYQCPECDERYLGLFSRILGSGRDVWLPKLMLSECARRLREPA